MGCVLMAALVYCFSIFGNSGGIWIGWLAYAFELNDGIVGIAARPQKVSQSVIRLWMECYGQNRYQRR